MNAAVLEDAVDVQPNSALAVLAAHTGPVLLDFDETIYLRNSTEDFIDSVRPAFLALFFLRILDAIKPWRFTGGEATRDVWRVRCILLLFPWTLRQWATRVHVLAATAGNLPLIAALQKRLHTSQSLPACPQPVIVTLGFEPIVAPLAAALGLKSVKIVACRIDTFADRREGKLKLTVGRLGHEAVRRALVLTDSQTDEPLLDACAVPMRTRWPAAHFRAAFGGVYMPGQYLTLVKRPGERYISRGILQEDFALWVLTSIGLSSQPIAHVFALGFLAVSFWAIYESGYVDNDRVAARYENDPKLSAAFGDVKVATPRDTPWIWAAVSGAIGVLLLHGFTRAAAVGFGVWMIVLAATFGAFALYNRFDKSTRIWWYGGLQLARSAAFVALLPIHLVGAMAIGAHVLAKWVPYYIYRVGGKHWPECSHFLPRLLFFVVLLALVAMTTGIAGVLSWSAAALLAWNIYRARHELIATFSNAKRLDRVPPQNELARDRTFEKQRVV